MSTTSKGSKNEAAKSRRVRRVDAGPADWSSVDPRFIRDAIAAVSALGGALRFGYTSDGGAYAVGVYGDGTKPYTEYIRPDESVEGFLEQLVYAWTDGAG